MWRQQPSSLLQISDPYIAFCVDEAAAELLSHNKPPIYPEDKKVLNKDSGLLKSLIDAGVAKVSEDVAL